MAGKVHPEKDLDKWEPIVLTFEYDYKACAEPCLCPCCCCPCCYHPLSCCQDQKTKVNRVHDTIFANYVESKVFRKGGIAVSFVFEELEAGGFKVTEIFRNIDAAEAYYDHFMSSKALMAYVLTNLPFRQKPGPNAAHSDGNVKAYVTNPARLAEGPQTVKFNHLKTEAQPSNKVEVVEWKVAPTAAELEAQFGQFHFGWRHKPSLAETETTMAATAPGQQAMS